MKKILIATTALAAFGAMASGAQAAQPLKVGVSGFMEQWIGYADNDNFRTGRPATAATGAAGTERNEVDVQSDTEVHFTGSTKLDNGLTVGVTVEFAGNGTDRVDEQFLTVSGSFGQIKLGQEDNVGALIHNASPDVGIGLQDGDVSKWISPANVIGGAMSTFAGDDTDAEKIVYVSPSFMGLAFGASYTPDIRSAGDTTIAAAGQDLWVAGFAYANEFSGVKVSADVGAGWANGIDQAAAANTGFTVYQGGLNVSYAGFTVGGSYMNRKYENTRLAATAFADAGDGYAWDAGVSYATGPYAVSLSYFQSSYEGAVGANNGNEDEIQSWMLSGKYTMGPGIDARASLFTAEYDDEAGAATPANSNEGWGLVTGMTVTF